MGYENAMKKGWPFSAPEPEYKNRCLSYRKKIGNDRNFYWVILLPIQVAIQKHDFSVILFFNLFYGSVIFHEKKNF